MKSSKLKQNLNQLCQKLAPLSVAYFNKITNPEDIQPDQKESPEPDIHAQKGSVKNLPMLISTHDAWRIVRLLKKRKGKLKEENLSFESHEIICFEQWGIIKRKGEQLLLTELGKRMAQLSNSEISIFHEVIASVHIYLLTIKWIQMQQLDLIIQNDIADFWEKLALERIIIKQPGDDFHSGIVNFFSLCLAAELGIVTENSGTLCLYLIPENVRKFLIEWDHTSNLISLLAETMLSPRSVYRFRDGSTSPIFGSSLYRVYISTCKDSDLISEHLTRSLGLAVVKASYYKITSPPN